ncbi:tetratricopeptide repeat protein [Thermodesulfobacteriota bacterium]
MGFSILKNRFSGAWPALVLITLIAATAYSNIYFFPFVFDDKFQIEEKVAIRDLSNYFSHEQLLKPRSIVDFTYALNYRLGKLNVFGYHLINVLIHILNGFLVYFLALTTLRQLSEFSKSSNPSILFMSLLTALIFIAHPIQTQAVTYTVQRYTSMAAMFYIASVLFYLKARVNQHRAESKNPETLSSVWVEKEKDEKTNKFKLSSFYVLSVFCGMSAFLSKQNTASLPGIILLVEYLLIDRTWQGWKKKLPWFALFFTFWTLFVLYISGLFSGGFEGRGLLEDVSGLMQETESVSRWRYLCTQSNVLVIYIRLLFLPIKQNLDYLYHFKSGFFDGYTSLAFLFLSGLVVLGIWVIKRRPIITLGIFWFFVTLSVESSIIPIRDAMFEHRLYLPLFGFALIGAYLLFDFLSDRRFWAGIISVAIILTLGTATFLRNRIWRDDVILWSDVVSKSSQNPRGNNNLGVALRKEGRLLEAIKQYKEALQINPGYVDAHNNLGNALVVDGRLNEAINHYTEAIRLNPLFEAAHKNLRKVRKIQKNINDTVLNMQNALKIKLKDPALSEKLKNLIKLKAELDKAIAQYKNIMSAQPGFSIETLHINDFAKVYKITMDFENLINLLKLSGKSNLLSER